MVSFPRNSFTSQGGDLVNRIVGELVARSSVRFLIVGAVVYVINAILLVFLAEIVLWDKAGANLISLFASVQVNFVFNNFWTFSRKPANGSVHLVWRITKHNLQRAVSVAGEQYGFVWLTAGYDVHYLIANAVVVVLATWLNFIAAKKFTFT